MPVHITAESLAVGFQIRDDAASVSIEPDTRTGLAHVLTPAGQLAVLDAVHAYHDDLTAEELAQIPIADDVRRPLVHIDSHVAHAAIAPFKGTPLAETLAEILRSPGMTGVA